MKFKFIFLIVFFIFLNGNSFASNYFLHRSNRILLDSSEKQIRLHGVNLGGWLFWEEWIWGGSFHSQTHVMDALTQMTSKEDVQKFRDSIYLNYISEDDIKKIAAAHLNVVRIPFSCKIFDENADPSSYKGIGWRVLDSVVKWCGKYGVYALIDMHGAPGGQSPYFTGDPDKEKLWQSEKKQEHAIAFWKAIAARYANVHAVAGYDLLNEPIPDKKENLVVLYKKMISAIRETDKNHMIVLEGGSFASDFSMFTQLPDSNLSFTFHFYNWFGAKPEKKVKKYVELSKRLNVPVWCGEWGENNYVPLKKTMVVWEDPTNKLSGSCFWTWKKVFKGSYPALNNIVVNNDWRILISAVQHKRKRKSITKEFALKAMNEFLIAIRSKNNVTDETILGILKSF